MFPADFASRIICYKVFPMSTAAQGKSADGPRLLVVDDDPGIRELLCRYLGEQGFRVTAVEDGTTMDAWLANNTPDLVVLDLMLPGEDGLSLARRLRSAHKLPIIMISARGEDVDRIVGLEVGADDYLPKPFNPRELFARCCVATGPRPMPSHPRTRNMPLAPLFSSRKSAPCCGVTARSICRVPNSIS